MAISKKHLTGELIPGKLDVSEQSKIGFANVFARSGLQNDIAAEANDFKLEVEVELSDIKNICRLQLAFPLTSLIFLIASSLNGFPPNP